MEASIRDEALEPVVESFLARFRAGERPGIEEYAARHPELADAIRALLPALVAVEQDLSIDRGERGASPSSLGTPRRLGDYRILREIGRGGMGVVYEAVQQSLGRHVALKVLPWGTGGPSSLDRFRLEARAAARLHHTNIVPVFGVGEDGGIHYFAMQYIRGQGLDQVVDELRRVRAKPCAASATTLAARLRDGRFEPPIVAEPPSAHSTLVLAPSGDGSAPHDSAPPSLLGEHGTLARSERVYFDGVARVALQVAEALAHAHGQGILHRDIKPSNLLLDTHGTVWVTDFGLAKSDDGGAFTRTGDILGTLRYMAPERFRGASDARSDVYALGATFYELLTLRPVFEESDRPRLVDEVLRREPPSPRSIDPKVPRDLEVICLKCLAKEPDRRYATADALAADLRRYLGGQTIQARQSGSLERTWRWCRRNPAVAGLLGALAASLAIGFAAVTHQAWRASVQRDEARAAAHKATQARAAELTARLGAQRLASRTAMSQGRSLADRGAVAQGMHWMATALQQSPAEDRAFARLVRRNLSAYSAFLATSRTILADEGVLTLAEFSGDGRRLSAIGYATEALDDPLSRQWDLASGRPVGASIAETVRFVPSPDGRTAAAQAADGSIQYLDVETARPAFTTPAGGTPFCHGVAWSPDGRLAVEYGAAGPGDAATGVLRLIDARDGHALGPTLAFDARVTLVAFRPDGLAFGAVCRDESLTLWSLDPTPRLVMKTRIFGAGGYYPMAFEPGGRWLAACYLDGSGVAIRFWDAATGKPLPRRIALGDRFAPWLAYSPDGRLLLSAEPSGVVRFWDAATDRPMAFPIARVPDKFRIRVHPSGRAVLAEPGYLPRTGMRLMRVPEGVWSTAAGSTVDLATSGTTTAGVDRLVNGRRMVDVDSSAARLVAAGTLSARVIDLETGQPIGEPIRNRWQGAGPVAISRDGASVAVVSNNAYGPKPGTVDCLVQICDAATGRPVAPPLHPINTVVAIDLSPDGKTIATGDFSDLVQLWDAATGDPIGPPLPQENIVWSLAFSPDGRRLAVGTCDERVAGRAGLRIWDVATRRPIGEAARHQPVGAVDHLLWSADGRTAASLSLLSKELILVDGKTGGVVARATDFDSPPSLVIAGVGGRLIVGTEEGAVELRDAATLQRLGDAMAPPDSLLLRRGVSALAAAPDGRTIAAGHVDGSIRLWDVDSRLPVGPPLRHDRTVLGLAFRRKGDRLSSISADGEVREWPVARPMEGPADRLALRLEVETGIRLRPTGDAEMIPHDELARRTQSLEAVEPSGGAILPPDDDPGRHDRAARYAEHRAYWFTARFHLDRLIAHRPEDALLLLRRALALAADGMAAEADLARAMAIGPVEACVDLLAHRADEARAAGRFDQAAWMLDHAIAARPGDWRLFADRAAVGERLGDTERRDADRRRAAEAGADALWLTQLADQLDAQSDGNGAGALRDLAIERLTSREATNLIRRLAADQANRGRLDRAAELLDRIDDQTDWGTTTYLRALAALLREDRAAYRALCAEALDRLGATPRPSLANSVAWTCVLGPGATSDPGAIVEQASNAVDRLPGVQRSMALNTLGAALLRDGRPSEAVERLEEGIRLRGGKVLVHDRVFLAMAHAALGAADASKWLAGPIEASTGGLEAVEFELLRREAVRLVLDPIFPGDPFAEKAP